MFMHSSTRAACSGAYREYVVLYWMQYTATYSVYWLSRYSSPYAPGYALLSQEISRDEYVVTQYDVLDQYCMQPLTQY